MFNKLVNISWCALFIFTLAVSVLILSACPPVEPEPTPTAAPTETPLPTPTPFNKAEAGTLWFSPDEQTVAVEEDFTTEIHLNSGTQNLGAYGIDIFYDESIINNNTDIGNQGVEAGTDGFISAVNSSNSGELKTTGFDAVGKGPGADLHLLTINWTALSAGEALLTLVINDFVDSSLYPIPDKDPYLPSSDTAVVTVE